MWALLNLWPVRFVQAAAGKMPQHDCYDFVLLEAISNQAATPGL
jgi:hypothetical protein